VNTEVYIVLRYRRIARAALSGIEAHGKRQGDDLDHVDSSRSHLNEFLVGGPDGAELQFLADARIVEMQKENAALKLAALVRGRRTRPRKEFDAAVEAARDDPQALAEVVGWPWHHNNPLPFTEGLLSFSHEWFLDDEGTEDPAKLDAFQSFVVDYLEATFGQEVIYLRLDRDEKTPHVHYVTAPEIREGRFGHRWLSHSSHRLFGRKEIAPALFDDENDPAPDMPSLIS
jgi:hypothetical protein